MIFLNALTIDASTIDIGDNATSVLNSGPIYSVIALAIVVTVYIIFSVIFRYFKADKKTDGGNIQLLIETNTRQLESNNKQMELLINSIQSSTEKDMSRIHSAVMELTRTLTSFTIVLEKERNERENVYRMNDDLKKSLAVQGERLGSMEQKISLIEERTRYLKP